jgi:hypothetical protein
MMYEPSRLEIYLTVAVGVVFSSIFKNYADRLDLTGSERVIELGPSAGNNSLHLARRLSTRRRVFDLRGYLPALA